MLGKRIWEQGSLKNTEARVNNEESIVSNVQERVKQYMQDQERVKRELEERVNEASNLRR